MIRRPPRSTPFPYPTLSRSPPGGAAGRPRPRLGAVARSPRRRRARGPPRRCRSADRRRSEEHTSELQSLAYLVCRLLLEKKKKQKSCYIVGLHTLAEGMGAI